MTRERLFRPAAAVVLPAALAAVAVLHGSCVGDARDASGDRTKAADQDRRSESRAPDATIEFRSERFGVVFEHPESWAVFASSDAAPLQVINAYPKDQMRTDEMPITVHAKADASHVSFYPHGYGTDYPTGSFRPFGDGDASPRLRFRVDSGKTVAFELESGDAWAWLLSPTDPPAGWSSEAFIFAQIAVRDLEIRCFDLATGEPRAPEGCDPMGGARVERHGTIDPYDRWAIVQLLESIRFEARAD